MSRLEKFINENREAFDDEMPSGNIWQGVESAISEKKKSKLVSLSSRFKWSIAAAVVILAGLGIFFKMQQTYNTIDTAHAKPDTANTTELAVIAPEESSEVNQFAKLIALKQDELKKLAKEQPELYQKFTKDINQLDTTYITLKKQLSSTPNKELLIEAMIQNLQLQLQVLNQQLHIINQIKNSKNDGHEKDKVYL